MRMKTFHILTAALMAFAESYAFAYMPDAALPIKHVSAGGTEKSWTVPNYYSLNEYATQDEAVRAMNAVKSVMQKSGLPVLEATVVKETYSDHDTIVMAKYGFTISYVKNSALTIENNESQGEYPTTAEAVEALNNAVATMESSGFIMLETGLLHFGGSGKYRYVMNYIAR